MKPAVSVIIVTYNSARWIRRSIQSVIDHTALPFEIIVQDNASSDASVQVVQELFPDISLIAGEENIGFAAGSNAAARVAKGHYLVFLNPDCFVTGGWLEPLVAALERDPTIGAVTPLIAYADRPETINTFGNEIYLSGVTYCRRLGEQVAELDEEEVGAVSGAAFAIARELFWQLGGFEPLYFAYYEDTDLSLRLRLAGYGCHAIPQSRVLHDYRPSFHHEKIERLERNRYLTLLSLFDAPTLIAIGPAVLVTEIAAWAYCLSRGRGHVAAKIRSWIAVARAHDWIMRRRSVQVSAGRPSHFRKALSPRLKLEYVGGRGLAVSSVEWLAYLVAAPLAALFRANSDDV